MYSSNTKNKVKEKHMFNLLHIKLSSILSFSTIQTILGFKPKADEQQLALIAGNLAQIYKAGIPLTTALELVADVLHNKTYKDSLVKVLNIIKQGKSLSEGFSEFKDLYPEFFIGIIAIGENTGKLYRVLKGLNVFYDKCFFIKKEIKNASAYPLFILASMIILIIFFLNKIIPNFCEIYKDMNIPLPSNCEFLYNINNTLKRDPVLTTITTISWVSILVILFKYFAKKINIGMFTKIKIIKSFFEYIMVILFSIITSTGINISQALGYCENSISFDYLKKKIRNINMDILKGRTLTESLAKSGIFSRYTLAIIKTREESGTIEEGFEELAHNLEYQLFEQIKKCLSRISPIFMGIMAAFIVAFMVEILIPLFDNMKSGMR